MALDLAGVAVSSGAACSSGKVRASHVLLAMGVAQSTSPARLGGAAGPAARPPARVAVTSSSPCSSRCASLRAAPRTSGGASGRWALAGSVSRAATTGGGTGGGDGATWRRDGTGRYLSHPIPGDGDAKIFTPDDLMNGKLPTGKVLIYEDDHYYMGGVLAELLTSEGHAVTLVTTAARVSSWTENTMEQERIQRQRRSPTHAAR